ncbi:MAG: 2Fe-2S iron-sulfur cluster-binding protein, partial [Anderseniella sp.]|nr:2Fe-2S iron-sulfur cluster-binding protein [Anderseniella sp.]
MNRHVPPPPAIRCSVNGKDVSLNAAPHERLSNVLRGELGLTGTKVGCDAGDCGACTVLIDGAPACACMTAAGQLDGAAVTTLEGLKQDGRLTRLQDAFLEFGAAQCGICTPGMLMSAAALLDATPSPTKQQVEDALGGVLCRCTGYAKIIDAVLFAAGSNAVRAPSSAGRSVGQPIRRVDGEPKVDGREVFGADGIPASALMVRVIRSPYHHARFTIGDTQAFLDARPGLVV